MGFTHIVLEVANVARPDDTRQVDCLVDSGAVHTVLPRDLLSALGIAPFTEDTYCMANGQLIRRQRGTAHFRYGETRGGADVVFGEPGDANLVGVTTLESLGLALDPFRRELKPMPMLLG